MESQGSLKRFDDSTQEVQPTTLTDSSAGLCDAALASFIARGCETLPQAQHLLRTGTIGFARTGAVRSTPALLGYAWKLRASSYCDGAGS
jgi:hypothetical protein